MTTDTQNDQAEQDAIDMQFMLGQVTGLLSKHRDRPDLTDFIYSRMLDALEHGIKTGRFAGHAHITEPTEPMICAVLDAQEKASHLFTRRNKLALSHEQHQLCRQGGGDIEVLASFLTDAEANDAWRRAKAAVIARALLATPIFPR